MDENKIIKTRFGIIIIVSVAAILLVVYSWYVMCKNAQLKRDTIETTSVKILSINYSEGINASFCYGVGVISGDEYYVAYEILEDGGKKIFKMDADETVVYDILDENAQAYVEIDRDGFDSIKQIRLYVPENSIQQKYDLSLE